MARSLKKGPFVALSLEKKVQKNVEENKRKSRADHCVTPNVWVTLGELNPKIKF